VQEVIEALELATRNNLPVAGWGSGYDWVGRSVGDGAFVIDLAGVAHVEVDSAARNARIGGGAIGAQVMVACSTHALGPIIGAVGGVGFVQFTVGGGYGPLTPGLGLGLDTLLAAEMVLADGAIVRIKAQAETDLFWAIRAAAVTSVS
jgi:FAD/FMN-containing dehydrogenase